jgi:hypothetical protein
MPLVLRSGTAVVIALAVAGLPLLPAEHIHRAGIEGRTAPLVHAHFLDGPDTDVAPTQAPDRHTSLKVGHGNHGLAIFLSTDYNGVSQFAAQPVALLTGIAMIVPAFNTIGSAHAGFVRYAHGPPRSVRLTRGPPSLA